MSYLAVPTRRGTLFQENISAHKLHLQKIREKAEEYNNRSTREGCLDDSDRVTINVGGEIFVTRKCTLRNVPSTMLAELNPEDEHYIEETGQYFFDRNPKLFQYILDFYRTGSMHVPRQVCCTAIKDELRYWGLGDGCISECCRKFYFDELDEHATYELIKSEFYNLPTYSVDEEEDEEPKQETKFQKFRRKAWVFIDNHESSTMAKVFAVCYYGFVILTILSLFFSTLPSIRVPLRGHMFVRSRVTPPDMMNFTDKNVTDTIKLLLTTDPPDGIVVIDTFCLLFFTLEFIFRLVVCPSIRRRLRSWYTFLDITYLVPAWIRFIVDISSPFYWQKSLNTIMFSVCLDAVKMLRVLRIFRLSRHYRGLRVLLLAIKASVSELVLLIVFVLFSLTIYACVSYCAEQISGKDTFESIFIALWWALITMTTVGYGDYYPSSTFGYIVASFCAISGLLIIGMVVPIIAGNFHHYYGFRYAGCDDVVLTKPEFVPTVNENPLPSCSSFEHYKLKRKLSSVSPKESLTNVNSNLMTSACLRSNVIDPKRTSSVSVA